MGYVGGTDLLSVSFHVVEAESAPQATVDLISIFSESHLMSPLRRAAPD